MKCPSCGAEIGNARFCSYCGSQISADMLRENEILNKVGCPRCGSTNVSFSRENQGEIRGEKSKRIIHYTVGVCKDCGYTWRTDGEQSKTKKKNSGTLSRLFNWLKTDNRWLWILGWLYIFPLPLTLILLKKKEMQSALKYGIIAAAWILYLVLGLVGLSSYKNYNNISVPEVTTVPPTSAVVVTNEATTAGTTTPIVVTTEKPEPTESTTSEVTEKETTETTTAVTTTKKSLQFVLSSYKEGDYGKTKTVDGYSFIAFYIPAGVYRVTNQSSATSQVSVYSGIGSGEFIMPDDGRRPIVLNPGESKSLEVKDGEFVKLADGDTNIQFVLK